MNASAISPPLATWQERLPERVSLFCSDPAGAKAMLSLAHFAQAQGRSIPVFTNRLYGHQEFSVISEYVSTERVADLIARGDGPILTGTSFPEPFDRVVHRAARTARRPLVAFVDHWLHFEERFLLDGDACLPDEIWVIDEYAKSIAEKECPKAPSIRVTGSPYYSFLKHQPPGPTKSLPFAATEDTPLRLLYAPEPMRVSGGREEFGFDEYDGVHDILQGLEAAGIDAVLLIKMHGRQSFADFLDHTRSLSSTVPVAFTVEGTPADYARWAHLIIGHTSTFLVEAKILGGAVLRYLPATARRDYLEHLDIGDVCRDAGQLARALQAHVHPAPRPPSGV